MTDDRPKRIDLTDPACPGRSHIHLLGYHGDGGENEGVLSLSAVLDASANYPECARIIVGSPQSSPLVKGYIPDLGLFTCGLDAAERLAHEILAAVAAVRAAMAAKR